MTCYVSSGMLTLHTHSLSILNVIPFHTGLLRLHALGCLPEVKNSDDSNLLSAVNVGLRQPNLQQQFNDYADMQRSKQYGLLQTY